MNWRVVLPVSGFIALVLLVFATIADFVLEIRREERAHETIQRQAIPALKNQALGNIRTDTEDGRLWWKLIDSAKLCTDAYFLSENRHAKDGSDQAAICVFSKQGSKLYVAVLGVVDIDHLESASKISLVRVQWKITYYYYVSGNAIHRYEGGGAEYMDNKRDYFPLLHIPNGELEEVKSNLSKL